MVQRFVGALVFGGPWIVGAVIPSTYLCVYVCVCVCVYIAGAGMCCAEGAGLQQSEPYLSSLARGGT